MKIQTGEQIEEQQGTEFLAISCALLYVVLKVGGEITLTPDDLRETEGHSLEVKIAKDMTLTISALSMKDTLNEILKNS